MEDRQSRQAFRGRLLGGKVLAAILVTMTAVALQWRTPVEPAASPRDAHGSVAIPHEHLHASTAKPSPSPPPTLSDDSPLSTPEQCALTEQLIGVWQQHKHGERTLRVNADGTATVQVELNMLGALMYGKRMTLQLNWSLDGDVMTQTISSGTPPESVQRLIRDWGNRREYRVIDVSHEHLILSEVGDDGDHDVWTSVESTPVSTASQTMQSPR